LRTLADLPWSGRSVRLLLKVRRFRCSRLECPRRIFAERLPDLVEPYARKTARLHEVLELVGFALGGEAGARLIGRLGMIASPSTLVRYVRRATLAAAPTPTVIGIDDFALRRGYIYATIIVDLQSHKPIDLLEDRESQTIASWLKAQPQLEIISRDRGSSYAEGATEGAPGAVQVADRWHLLKNLGSALERFAARHSEHIKQAAKSAVQSRGDDYSSSPKISMSSMLRDTTQERESNQRRQKRYDRYQKVMELYNQGVPQTAIARQLGMGTVTVNTYVHSEGFPERSAHHSSHRSILEPYIPYIHKRWVEGCQDARQLWREIKEMGYPGKDRMVRRYAVNLRKMLAESSVEEQAEFLEASTGSLKAPSARRAAWWLAKPEEDLKNRAVTS
jgi:transposase